MHKGWFWPHPRQPLSPSFSTPHSSYPPSYSFLYKGCLPPCINMLNLNSKENMHILCETCVLLALGLILSGLRALKWRPSTLILEATILQLACQFSTHTISFLLPSFPSFPFTPFYLVFLYLFPFGSSFVFCVVLPFYHSTMFHFIVSFHVFQFPQCIIIVTLYWFSFLPLEVNLHTYLTTCLCSCPVGIFPRSNHIIAKISITSKVSPLKWNHLKSTQITCCHNDPN